MSQARRPRQGSSLQGLVRPRRRPRADAAPPGRAVAPRETRPSFLDMLRPRLKLYAIDTMTNSKALGRCIACKRYLCPKGFLFFPLVFSLIAPGVDWYSTLRLREGRKSRLTGFLAHRPETRESRKGVDQGGESVRGGMKWEGSRGRTCVVWPGERRRPVLAVCAH